MPGCGPTGRRLHGGDAVGPDRPPAGNGTGASGAALLGHFVGGFLRAVEVEQHLALPPIFWLDTMHCACGSALPTEPPKAVFKPMPCRIFTAFSYGSPITLT